MWRHCDVIMDVGTHFGVIPCVVSRGSKIPKYQISPSLRMRVWHIGLMLIFAQILALGYPTQTEREHSKQIVQFFEMVFWRKKNKNVSKYTNWDSTDKKKCWWLVDSSEHFSAQLFLSFLSSFVFFSRIISQRNVSIILPCFGIRESTVHFGRGSKFLIFQGSIFS